MVATTLIVEMYIKRPISTFLLLGIVVMLSIGIGTPLFAQPVEGPAATALTGSTQVTAGSEVEIYRVGFAEPGPGFPFAAAYDVGHPGQVGVSLTISDLTAPTGLVSADFTALNLYRSTDNTLDTGADFLIAQNTTVNIGAVTDIDADGGGFANRTMTNGGTDYLFVTAVIASNATAGHTFRVAAALDHVGFEVSPNGATVDGGTPIVAADGNNIVIAAQSPSFISGVAGGGRGIPFGGEPVILVLLLGTGLYMIRRVSR